MDEEKRKAIIKILNSARDKSASEQLSALEKVEKIIEDIINSKTRPQDTKHGK